MKKQMSRKAQRFYTSESTEDFTGRITTGFKKASQLSSSLAVGKFSDSVIAGTSLTAIDIFRATQIKLQEIEESFIRNAINSLIFDSCQAHHALAGFLSAHFLGYSVHTTPHDVMVRSRCATSSDADQLYQFIVHDDRTKSIFHQIRCTAGSSAHIVIQKTPAKRDAVILRQNNVYPLAIPQEFWRYCHKQKLEFIEAKVLAVDGVIISVGEINSYLSSAFENKQPLIILCRGISEEVLATLLKNFEMGKLNVFPIQVAMGETANFLHDISYLCGAEIVSTITGDVLASKDEECLGLFARVTIHKHSIEFDVMDENRRTSLVKRIQVEKNEYINEFGPMGDFAHVFDARHSSASAESCHVYVSDNGIGQTGIVLDRLASLGRIHNELKERGVVDLKNLEGKTFRDLETVGLSILPTSSLVYSLLASKDTKNKLLNSSRILIVD